ncbi:MAG: beta-glucosidase [Balneolaceae bacterium]|nr:MAG: beta-glucosidase [Balneolaceae bacterium]
MTNQWHRPETNKGSMHALPYKNSSLSAPERVDDLMQRLTLPEKIGQMTQLDITMINTTGKQKDVDLDPEKARDMILNHHIGSFLNGEAAPARTWYEFMRELMRISVEETRLGIPVIFGIDHIHGASYLEGATIFPQGINLAASFNPGHARNTGRVTAVEAADLGHHWIFTPILDLGVQPLWPRLWETFGEDPHLAASMGAAFVNGLQNCEETAPLKLAATGKHFLGYSDPRSGWDRTPACLSMQQIHEFHRPSFQKAVDAGLRTIMTNSGEINGVPVVASHEILTRLLRDQMGFEGVIVTDWDDIGKLVNFHYTAENFKQATCDAVMAGIDMSMTPLHLEFNTSLLELVEEGRITGERIDESVRRILTLKFELGLFEHPYPRDDRFERIGCRDNRQQALDAARESLVLLKNDNRVLPVKKPSRIGILGPSANSRRNLCGGWTIAWQGGRESQYPDHIHTIYTALAEEFPDAEVHHFGPDDIPAPKDAAASRASFIEKLNGMDVLVYAGGEEPYCEFAGNITDLGLPENQVHELKLLSESTSPLVLVLVQGRPRLINDVIDIVDAILFAGLPGFEGAGAIANVISGRVNPSGRMPISYPMNPSHYLPYNHKKSNLYFFDPAVANQIVQGSVTNSLFPFGYGLSYTTFEYSDLTLDARSMDTEGSIKATVKVSNTGRVEGVDTVLWFTSTHVGRITRPVKELKHFEKVRLKPGESATLTFVITPDQVAYPDENGDLILEKGKYSIMAGDKKQEFRITG